MMISHDRNSINVNPNMRVHWALGILGVEDDMRKLDSDNPLKFDLGPDVLYRY
jgi:hypothetical protein